VASRRDQLQSYQFLTQRVLSALVMRETDPAQSPLRRGVGAVFVGIMVAVMVGAGFGIYGILTKTGSTNWKAEGAVIVEKESGASYVYQNGKLNPMLNYASALLVAGQPVPHVFRVAANSLAGMPRGVTRGIPGAPNSLPPGNRTVGLPWTLCSTLGIDDTGQQGAIATMVLGGAPSGARELADSGLLVADDAATYLIWRGRRYRLRQATTVVPILFGSATATRVGTAWTNGLPEGEDIAPIAKPTGTPTVNVSGHPVGSLLVATPASGNPLYYLVYPDGVVTLTALQASLVQPAPTKVTIDVDAGVSAPKSARQRGTGPDSAPANAPQLTSSSSDTLLCLRSDDARRPPVLTVGGKLDTAGAAPTRGHSATGTAEANQIMIPAGHVAVVRTMSSPGGPPGALELITDVGIRYSVPDDKVLQTLGYNPAKAVNVPGNLVHQIPAGPALEPGGAARAAPLPGTPN